MSIPVQSKKLELEDDFLNLVNKENIVLKNRDKIFSEMHRSPNPVRHTAATRTSVGSNPTLCSKPFSLEKRNACERETIFLEKKGLPTLKKLNYEDYCGENNIINFVEGNLKKKAFAERKLFGEGSFFQNKMDFENTDFYEEESVFEREEFVDILDDDFELRVDFEIPKLRKRDFEKKRSLQEDKKD